MFGGKSSTSAQSDNQAIAAVNPNYQHYKKLADERGKLENFKREPKRELTQEEREERIRAMQRDADEHEADRHKRARKSREEDERERAELMGRASATQDASFGGGSGPSFVSEMKRATLGVSDSSATKKR